MMADLLGIQEVDPRADIDKVERALRELPFVNLLTDKDTPYWSIDPTGDKASDLHLGLLCGELALAAAREFHAPLLVATIMRDMVKAGQFGMVEAGFVATIACAAKVGSHN